MSLMTLATAKQFAQISHTAEDTALQIILDGAEEWIEKHCGVRMAADISTALSEDLDGGERNLWPTHLPILAVSSITDTDDNSVEDADDYIVETTRIECYDSTKEYFLSDNDCTEVAKWGTGRRRYRVSYTAGYNATTLPSGLQRAILHFFYQDYHCRGRVSSQSGAEGSASYEPAGDNSLLKMLEGFKLKVPIS